MLLATPPTRPLRFETAHSILRRAISRTLEWIFRINAGFSGEYTL